ncbi:MAG: hypothetical protein V2A58_13540 [Planctomycetota bacterium]
MGQKRSEHLREWLENLPEEKHRQVRAWLARGILILVAVSLYAFLVHEGTQYAEELPYFTVDPAHIHITERPTWLTDDIEGAILDVPCLSRPFNIMEEGITERVGRSIEASPWVRKVCAVRKQFPNNISIEMELRRPVAYVSYNGTLYAVDRFGVRLPTTAARLEEAPWRLPSVLVADSAPPEVGEEWDGDVVRAACRVAERIGADEARLPVSLAAIDVRSRWERGECQRSVTLYTLEGPTLLWGSPPDEETHGEPGSDEKIANLVAFGERTGDLAGMEYVDLRFGATVYWKERGGTAPGSHLSASRQLP